MHTDRIDGAAHARKRNGSFVKLVLVSLFFLCLPMLLIFSSCEGREVVTETTSPSAPEKSERTHIAVDLGEIDNLTRRFFPETRVNQLYVKLISIPLSEVISNVRYEDSTVILSFLPIRTHLGKVISGSDLIENIKEAYKEDINHFSANIVESSSESLDIVLAFDREVDFEAEFYSLPIYPVSYLRGEDYDSLGEYRVSAIDSLAQRIELISDHSDPIFIVHNDFEIAKSAFESGDLDILYLPRSGSARLWADTVRGMLVKVPSNRVYMVGFSPSVPFEHRVMLYMRLANQEFINNYMGGFGEMTTFPARSRKAYEVETGSFEPLSLPYICFVDSEWSYQFYRHLDTVLSSGNIYLNPVFTDFMTMMHMAEAEDAQYVYAFAWDMSANTPLTELLGTSFEDVVEWTDEVESRYFDLLPVIPIASPYDYYLIKSNRVQHIVE